MVDANGKAILALLKKNGNNNCADCGSTNPEWASYNIGIFICTRCAKIHKGMGAHISKVKHIKLDRWEDSQLERMKEVGNIVAKLKYESRVPVCYRRPQEDDPQSLLEDWICAKYIREEFSRQERPSFMSGFIEGFLMKRGKEDARYHPRKFILSEDNIRYFVKEKKDPKAVLKLCDLNVAFAPEKTKNPNTLQLTYLKNGITRHIYVCHDDPQTIVNWYMAIRCTKLHRLQIAYPSANEDELLEQLTQDFAREGWLWKTGPRPTDAYKKRWFTLDDRKLMYHEEPLDAHPKGEIFLGHMLEGYSVRIGVPIGTRDHDFTFTLTTPERLFYLSAMSSFDRDLWIEAIQAVLNKPLTSYHRTQKSIF
uniref:Arf-GAP domain-containing protein n=2 Tax=Clastoptera arizonana TaxID=38151 RepID=A0A1B6CL23_9HEMI